jgi:hypothetical protein
MPTTEVYFVLTPFDFHCLLKDLEKLIRSQQAQGLDASRPLRIYKNLLEQTGAPAPLTIEAIKPEQADPSPAIPPGAGGDLCASKGPQLSEKEISWLRWIGRFLLTAIRLRGKA